jgi:hypothetical protein
VDIRQIKKIVQTTSAYLAARQHKRWKLNTKQFGCQRERACNLLEEKIKKRHYKIKPSLCFIAFLPVKREIFAGDFSDRIIHHYLFQKLNPNYDRQLIADCYSCRLQKGTSYGIKRTAHFMQAVSHNYTRKAYVLKLDIKGYFMNIDRHLLYQQNKRLLANLYPHNCSKINEILYLLKLVIFNDPTVGCRLRGRKSNWQGLPKNKSLFFSSPGKGLPIGNLTSQLFGNIYLNAFDHFIKRKLKCHYYGRYVDDMIFFHHDREYLKKLIPQISQYLKDKLGLELHEKKIYLQEISYGVKFLGAVIKPNHIHAGPRLIKNFHRCLVKASKNQANIQQINSYLGLLKQFHSFNLRKKYFQSYIGQAALKALQVEVNADYSKVSPCVK